MRAGVECEIFVDELDRWISASIRKLNVVFVPNTEIVMKTFIVEYKYATDEEIEADPSAGEDRVEEDVRSDRLRLLVDADYKTKEMIAEEEEAAAAAEVVKVLDTNTGLGGWATVSVSVYDEAAEAAKREAEAEEEHSLSLNQSESLKRAREFAEEDNESVNNRQYLLYTHSFTFLCGYFYSGLIISNEKNVLLLFILSFQYSQSRR